VNCPKARRIEAWDRLAAALSAKELDAVTSEVGLADVISLGPEILAGRVRGRTLVAMSK